VFTTKLRFVRTAGTFVLAVLMLLFGYAITSSGYRVLDSWTTIGSGFAAYGLLWIVAGPAMLAGGLWVFGSLGRNRIPLWIGGVAALLSGSSLIAGVLTYVIPCSGPS
jgi:hypothetical protein